MKPVTSAARSVPEGGERGEGGKELEGDGFGRRTATLDRFNQSWRQANLKLLRHLCDSVVLPYDDAMSWEWARIISRIVFV